jgi:hypothetical protein
MSQSVMKLAAVAFVVACAPLESTNTAEPSPTAAVGASWAECPRFDPESAIKARMANDLSCPDAIAHPTGATCRDGPCPDWTVDGCGRSANYVVNYTFEHHANCPTSVDLMGTASRRD